MTKHYKSVFWIFPCRFAKSNTPPQKNQLIQVEFPDMNWCRQKALGQ